MITITPRLTQTLSKVIPSGKFWTKRLHLVSGCSPVSEGCANCWMCREARIREKHPIKSVRKLHEDLLNADGHWNGAVRFNQHLLQVPFFSRTPQVYALWSDLFHESVSDKDIDQAMAVILACAVFSNRPHTFIAPTKRAKRQQSYFSTRTPAEHIRSWAKAGNNFIFCDDPNLTFEEYVLGHCYGPFDNAGHILSDHGPWGYVEHLFPLPNLIGCVTTENQSAAELRLPDFAMTPFNYRMILAEPLLGELDLRKWLPKVHGVITGGESGHNARPSNPTWFRSLGRQCKEAGIPFFFKGWGEWLGYGQEINDQHVSKKKPEGFGCYHWPDGNLSIKVKKKTARRMLDGVEYSQLPES